MLCEHEEQASCSDLTYLPLTLCSISVPCLLVLLLSHLLCLVSFCPPTFPLCSAVLLVIFALFAPYCVQFQDSNVVSVDFDSNPPIALPIRTKSVAPCACSHKPGTRMRRARIVVVLQISLQADRKSQSRGRVIIGSSKRSCWGVRRQYRVGDRPECVDAVYWECFDLPATRNGSCSRCAKRSRARGGGPR